MDLHGAPSRMSHRGSRGRGRHGAGLTDEQARRAEGSGAASAPRGRPSWDARAEMLSCPRRAPASTRQTPDAADGEGLAFDVREEGPVAIARQSLLDEGPQDDLQTHRELERG